MRGLTGVVAGGLAAAAIAAPPPVAAEVIAQSDAGFVSEHRVEIAAPPEAVWDLLVRPGQWWQSTHSYSGDAANMSLDLRVGGCWCEALANGGGAEHLRIVYLDPGATLRLRGGLGPLQGMGVAAALTFRLEPAGTGTRLHVRYAVGGFAPDGLGALAAPVDSVLGQQIESLKRVAETAAQ